jgi:AcrR family transcriptional regulator
MSRTIAIREELPHLKSMGRRERRAAETRIKLFQCALQLFAERGFPNVTVEDITELADVGKGTFFNYFKSKDQVLRVMAEIQLGKLREVLETSESSKRSTRSVLNELCVKVSEEPGRSPELARALLAAFLSSTVREQVAQDMAEGRRLLSRILKVGQKRGDVDPKLNTEQMALHFQQAFIGTMLLWSMRGEQKLEIAVDATFQQFWKSIAAKN